MKVFSLILFLTVATSLFNSTAHASEDIDLRLESITRNTVEPHPVDSRCLSDFRQLRNRYAIQTGFAPVLGLAGLTETAVLVFDWEYGGWGAFKASLGIFEPAAYTLVSDILPLASVFVLFGYESYAITRFVESNHAYRLLKDVYGIGDGKMLKRVTVAIQKKKSELTEEDIRQLLAKADQDGDLCSGAWVTGGRSHHKKKTLARRVTFLKDIESHLSQ